MEASSIRCLISAGPTREYLDPVRFLSNPSTGRMGFALAEAAAVRGWSVTLVAGPVELPTPAGVVRIDVETGDEMHRALEARFDDCNILIMTAAVMDYRPRERLPEKVKKGRLSMSVEMEPTVDILATLGVRKAHQILVGFAAETHNVEAYAREKLERKNLDWIAANEVGRAGTGFASATNRLLLLGRGGQRIELGEGLKTSLAVRLLDEVSAGHRDSSSVCVP
jgi:phosphopantothenoylcysteine decarboxylase/phosphopantothenate--cysteine ligase